ncbi:MAG: outer membrane lipid asymmetry maintenance protein MlaD [Rhizobiales bacterium]|nr:outer membrane lipid asymmetry maintenance protein MlaD [Hyphomicrobiales bacterium]MBI3674941.1 outer membrane lipid asymmetry maintenance protein MlaD [Hyphomicrobiales bacterium]
MKNTAVETLIGAAVIVIAAAFFLFAYQTSGKGSTTGGYRLVAQFDNAEGVNVGTDVRMAGVKIGTVVAMVLNPENYMAKLTLQVDPALKFKDDATAKVTAEGLLGSKFISLEQGGSETVLPEDGSGEIINTQGAVDIWALISQTMFDKGAKPPAGGDGGAGTKTP